MTDSAVFLVAESLAEFVDRWRAQSVLPVDPPIRLSEAIPPHLTLLSPWLPHPTEPAATERLQEAVGRVAPFELTFRTVSTFPAGTVFLSPDPSPGLESLFQALLTAFPDYPPYGGQFEGWVPHLTVSRRGGEEVAVDVRAELQARGPLRLVADEVSGWGYRPTGHWVRGGSAPLSN
jgi:2'-5' RNA ligase